MWSPFVWSVRSPQGVINSLPNGSNMRIGSNTTAAPYTTISKGFSCYAKNSNTFLARKYAALPSRRKWCKPLSIHSALICLKKSRFPRDICHKILMCFWGYLHKIQRLLPLFKNKKKVLPFFLKNCMNFAMKTSLFVFHAFSVKQWNSPGTFWGIFALIYATLLMIILFVSKE